MFFSSVELLVVLFLSCSVFTGDAQPSVVVNFERAAFRQSLENAVSGLGNENKLVRTIAVPSENQWVLVPSSGQVEFSENVPGNVVQTIRLLEAFQHQILHVLFHDTQNFFVVTDHSPFCIGNAIRVCDKLRSVFSDAETRENLVDMALFGENGYVVLLRDNHYRKYNAPSSLFHALLAARYANRGFSSITTFGEQNWILVAQQWVASSLAMDARRYEDQANGVRNPFIVQIDSLRKSGTPIDGIRYLDSDHFLIFSNADQVVAATPLECTEQEIWKAIADFDIPGMSVATIENGALSEARTYGIKKKGEPEHVSTGTRFYYASLSKYLTGLAAARVMKIKNIDPRFYTFLKHLRAFGFHQLSSWIRQAARRGYRSSREMEDTTLRQLFDHTAGFCDSSDRCNGTGQRNGHLETWQLHPGDRYDALSWLLGTTDFYSPRNDLVWPSKVPGGDFAYSNAAYEVIAALLEDLVPGKRFSQIMHEYVFDRFGMQFADIASPLPARAHTFMAWPHESRNGTTQPMLQHVNWIAPAGVIGTAVDYVKALLPLVRDDLIADIEKRRLVNDPGPNGYTLGLRHGSSSNSLWHTGTFKMGTHNRFWLDRANRRGIVILTNRGQNANHNPRYREALFNITLQFRNCST